MHAMLINEVDMAFDLLRLLVCAAIAWVCFCRLVELNDGYSLLARLRFVLVGGAAMTHGVAPFVHEAGSWPGAVFALAVLLGVAHDMARWKNGPPPELKKHVNPLKEGER